jgi:hypothetical protein
MTASGTPHPGETDRYFRAVEEHFVRLRGAPLVLSPDDWHLAATWLERRIPLPVVLRAMSEVFETARARGRRKPVLSLSYCRHAVEEAHAAHLESAVGEARAGSASSRRRPLRERVVDWRERAESWGAEPRRDGMEMLDAVLAVVSDLDDGRCSADAAEKRLAELERGLLEAAARAFPQAERDDLMAGCEGRLAEYRDRMSPEVYARTRQRALEGELRRRLALPRLSLLMD